MQLWESALKSNIEILERIQLQMLRNEIIRQDLKVSRMKAEIARCGEKYIAQFTSHQN